MRELKIHHSMAFHDGSIQMKWSKDEWNSSENQWNFYQAISLGFKWIFNAIKSRPYNYIVADNLDIILYSKFVYVICDVGLRTGKAPNEFIALSSKCLYPHIARETVYIFFFPHWAHENIQLITLANKNSGIHSI